MVLLAETDWRWSRGEYGKSTSPPQKQLERKRNSGNSRRD